MIVIGPPSATVKSKDRGSPSTAPGQLPGLHRTAEPRKRGFCPTIAYGGVRLYSNPEARSISKTIDRGVRISRDIRWAWRPFGTFAWPHGVSERLLELFIHAAIRCKPKIPEKNRDERGPAKREGVQGNVCGLIDGVLGAAK